KAQPVASFSSGPGQPDTSIKTLYLYDSARVATVYDPSSTNPDVRNLEALLTNVESNLLFHSGGLIIDLGGKFAGSPIQSSSDPVVTDLIALHNQWAGDKGQPLLANEVARQIWYVIDTAIGQYYPNVENIVLIGGDNIIPFFRVPDETKIGNEGDYYSLLTSAGALNTSAGGANKTYVGGSTFFRMIQTDNYYADRRPTPWRGRGLYLPELAIGRLVETPNDILRYLQAYDFFFFSGNPYIIDTAKLPASGRDTTRAGAAYVTGYDFVTDEAERVSDLYTQFGFSSGATLGREHALKTLIGDSWSQNDLTSTWFNDQLPQLTTPYSTVNTFYHLMSLNGHFTHYSAIPANNVGAFTAQQLYNPTVEAGFERQAYFIDPSGDSRGLPSTSLIYSIGCHSGLNVVNGDINSATPQYQYDFASAALKQGGNWIGNTGFGYGDSDLIAYSEKLALLLTKALGRDVEVLDPFSGLPVYVGATVGESLAWAKREYVRTAGPGSFGVYDEKVLEETTLYGLPFIRVKVPNPNNDPYLGAFDPAARPVPENIRITTADPTFTRTITVTIAAPDFPIESEGGDSVPRVNHATLLDSFAPGETIALTGTDLLAAGKPVLPLLTYDLTLLDTGLSGGDGSGIPEPRGVRLLSATNLPEISGFNPHVTTITTDTTFAQQHDDPDLTVQGQWLPDQPYTFLRTAVGTQYNDKLLVNPAQFWADSARAGRLRRFSQLVFEVSYVDPNSATGSALTDETPPEISDVTISLPQLVARQAGIAAQQIQVSALVKDDGGASGTLDVSITYSNDGMNWQLKPLTFNAGAGLYTGSIDPPAAGQNIAVIVEAKDGAGNVANYTAKGSLKAFSILALPVLRR
ncbi:MAG TPA: hypothetical protein VFU22_07455, partial [Roseiflexaceae bacterium]|nr:hypothetical protein [Roseiflexaceae bacterium]